MTHPARLYPQLRLVDRLIALVAWSVAVAIFVTIGWGAVRPADPRGAVSMLTCPRPWLMVLQTAALSMVVASAVTLLVGRKLSDAGAFATCLGLAVANLRADTFESMLIGATDAAGKPGVGFAAGFMVEAVLWWLIVVLAAGCSGLVFRWCFGRSSSDSRSVLSAMMVTEFPPASALFHDRVDDSAKQTSVGARHLLMTAVLAFALIGVLSTGVPAPTIKHGQVYFAVAASFFLAAYLAHGWFPCRTAFWSCLAVPVVSVAAYLWAMMADGGAEQQLPPHIPHSAYFRALPLEYVILGTMGAILAFWWTRHSYAARWERGEVGGRR